MDRDLLRQSVSYHGQSLFSLLKCEQSENPDFKQVALDLSKSVNQRDKDDDSPVVEQFIARKADLLFAPSWKTTKPVEDEWQEDLREPFAVMPPLEQFMEASYEERREHFYRDVERGDIVIGRITSIRDFGFFVVLLCTAGDFERDVEDLEISGLCPIRDVPSTGNHDDPLSYYQIGDLIRAGVKDIDRYHEKLTISLYSSSLAPNLDRIKLGVISKEDLPLHYIRGEKVANDSSETYERLLDSSLGFSNPANVDVLIGKLGINDTQSTSLMRGLQSKHFMEDDFASAIRKKQSASWALKCVKLGVDHFKSGRHVEAMNEYNKALEIDTNNVEALVARGALLEEEEKLVTAESLYKKAISLDETFQEAEEALRKLQMHIQKTLKLKAEEASKEKEKQPTVETSAEKLRKILKEEKRLKKKRRRSDSSSVSSSDSDSSSVDSSPSSSRKKSKKRKHKRRRSSHGSKKHKKRVSSRDNRTPEEQQEEEEDEYPLPVNISASFINEKHTLAKLLSEEPEAEDRLKSGGKSREDSRGRFEDDPFDLAQSSKTQGQHNGPGVNGRGRETEKQRRKSDDGHGSRKDSSSSSHRDFSRSRKDSSSSAHSEHSRKSDRPSRDDSAQSSYRGRPEVSEYERRDKADHRNSRGSNGNERRLSSGDRSRPSEESHKKALPANLLDIFNQIAEFEKEKKQKK
uniref:S1 motif domain-containing protein n=1 Tax=Astyanax mexicanus TaxID=7994 RepID=A0A8B9JS23_ASTMX